MGSAFAKQLAEIELGKRKPEISVGNLEPKRDFTDVRDVVDAYVRLLEKPRSHGVFNVCSGKSIPVRRLLDLLLEISGLTVSVIPDPKRQRASDAPDITGTAARLEDATGWKPTIPLEQTLRDLFAYWSEEVAKTA